MKRRGERRTALPEDLDWTVYLTEAQKNVTTGNIDTALKCAQKVSYVVICAVVNIIMINIMHT